ncbi:HIT zinc finger [Phlyctema vagabunda]|uniref:HIT zinc finger n=1 Tax=Phlyctema vagabunda TaxID=108571 RepID=A0ABR4P397_9HELO
MSIPDQDPDAILDDSRVPPSATTQDLENPTAPSGSGDAMGEAAETPANPKLCGVCRENEHKYKCTRCLLPYCSVACSTIHRATHPAIEAIATPSRVLQEEPARAPPKALAGTVGFKDPFAALENAPQIQELFKMFPNLPGQLDKIHSATLPPLDDPSRGARSSDFFPGSQGRGAKTPSWNRDKGLQSGVEALTKARHAYGKDGEGVREFSRVVLQILSGEDETAALRLLEKEMAEENARVISQLLESNS